MKLDLEAIEARITRTTPGPWTMEAVKNSAGDTLYLAQSMIEPNIAAMWDKGIANANGDFIAHAREDVPELLAEVKRLRAAISGVGGDPMGFLTVNVLRWPKEQIDAFARHLLGTDAP